MTVFQIKDDNSIKGIVKVLQKYGVSDIDIDTDKFDVIELIFVGILSIVISLIVLAHPVGIGIPLLAFMISIALIIDGIEMIGFGIAGRRRFSSKATEESCYNSLAGGQLILEFQISAFYF
jgi:hypothetical protein